MDFAFLKHSDNAPVFISEDGTYAEWDFDEVIVTAQLFRSGYAEVEAWDGHAPDPDAAPAMFSDNVLYTPQALLESVQSVAEGGLEAIRFNRTTRVAINACK